MFTNFFVTLCFILFYFICSHTSPPPTPLLYHTMQNLLESYIKQSKAFQQ